VRNESKTCERAATRDKERIRRVRLFDSLRIVVTIGIDNERQVQISLVIHRAMSFVKNKIRKSKTEQKEEEEEKRTSLEVNELFSTTK
jgi:hypothetical protein